MSTESFEIINPINDNDFTNDPVENTSIETLIKEYVSLNDPTLYILTPCYGGLCHVNYIICLMETIKLFTHFAFPIKIEFCKNDSLVSRARNNLIAKAMSDIKTSHILFIDSDITWKPIDIFKLILSEKSLIGGIYPLKRYQWKNCLDINQEFLDAKNNSYLKDVVSDDDAIRSKLLKFNVNYLEDTLRIEKNIGKVRHIATGFMMMRRSLIENMFIAYPSTKYSDDVGFLTENENKYAYALFDCGVEDGHYLSEDWMFCNRWRKMNEDVFVDISIDFAHTGMEDFSGSILTSFFQK